MAMTLNAESDKTMEAALFSMVTGATGFSFIFMSFLLFTFRDNHFFLFIHIDLTVTIN